jgi:6-phosphogluconolactonase (cycloisomerase 2 family)
MSNQTFFVGTGVESIYSCSLTSSGQLQLLNEAKSGKGPTWLLLRDNLLHASVEHTSSIGNTPCSLDIDPSGKWLAAAK